MKKYLLLPIIFLFLSCEKEIALDLKEQKPMLTIEAKIVKYPTDGKAAVKLTMSKGLYNNSNEYEPVTDAQVYISDEQGNSTQLHPNTENVYVADYNLNTGKTYRLDVIKGDKHATASATIPAIVPIHDFVLVENNGRTYLDVYFDDDPNQDDYYIFNMINLFNGGSSNSHYIMRDDVFFDRTEHKLRIENGFLSGNTNISFKLEIYHINKLIYDYFHTLDNIQDAGFGVTPFTTSVPGNPNTNVVNGIGYFSAEACSSLVKTSLNIP